jgi:LEA14-like dessication related protein
MKNKFIKTIMLIVAFVLGTGCSQVAKNMVDNIDYKLTNIDINVLENSTNLLSALFSGNIDSMAKVSVTPHIEVTNKNSMDFEIYKTEYKIFAQNAQIAEGVSNKSLMLKANSTADFAIPIDIQMNKIAKNSMDILVNQEMKKIKVIGRNYIKTSAGSYLVDFTIKDKQVKVESIEGI